MRQCTGLAINLGEIIDSVGKVIEVSRNDVDGKKLPSFSVLTRESSSPRKDVAAARAATTTRVRFDLFQCIILQNKNVPSTLATRRGP